MTKELAGCKLDGSSIVYESDGEVVDEGHVVGGPEGTAVKADNMPPVVVDFELENLEDGAEAQSQARHIKIEFEPNDVKFWFSQLEAEMLMATVKSQWLKKTILQRNLPNKQREDVKAYLILTQAEAGDTIYKDIKDELIRLYSPKPQDSYLKALSREMTGLPSQLGTQIIDDICKKTKKLEGCCCAAAALAIWSMKLPVGIRAHISDKPFTRETYKEVFQTADKVFQSSKQINVAATALDETLPAFTTQNQPSEVAAVSRGQRGGRGGRNRGGRGYRGNRGGNRGGASGTSTGGNSGNSGNSNNSNQSRHKGKRHSSSPPEACCERHYVHGDQAFYCLEPTTCPWVDKCIPRN